MDLPCVNSEEGGKEMYLVCIPVEGGEGAVPCVHSRRRGFRC